MLAREALTRIVHRTEPPRVLVVGDVMLDRFVWGDVARISPEAPVPVVRVGRETESLGGAANVAVNLRSLGAWTAIVGIVGSDPAGDRVRAILEELDVEDRLLHNPRRTTTVKTRIVARAQQVVRVDREDDAALDADDAERLGESIREALPSVDAVVVSDYDKGALDGRLLASVLPEAAGLGVPVVIDPKLRNFGAYQPATVVTPNQDEAARATATEVRTDDDCVAAARTILERLETGAVLIMRGSRGMLLLERGGEPDLIPALEEASSRLGAWSFDKPVANKTWLGSDHHPFILAGVPAVTFNAPIGDESVKFYHDFGDTFDKIDRQMLTQGTAVYTLVVLDLANDPTPMRRYDQAEVEKIFVEAGLEERMRAAEAWPY